MFWNDWMFRNLDKNSSKFHLTKLKSDAQVRAFSAAHERLVTPVWYVKQKTKL